MAGRSHMLSAGSQRIHNFYFHEEFPFSAIPIKPICYVFVCVLFDNRVKQVFPPKQHLAGQRASLKLDGVAIYAGGNVRER